MVLLLPKSQIQSLNIDTVEKALVFGSLMLRAALIGLTNENTEDLNVTIGVAATGETTANLSLEVYLPYDAYEFNLSGGLLLDNLRELTVISSTVGDDVTFSSFPTNSGLIIPDYDESVINTFEKYLLYYAQILWASVTNKRSSTIELTLLGNQINSQVLISANLPIDLNSWLLGSNYLNALGTVVTEYVSLNSGDNFPPLPTQQNTYSISIDYPTTFGLEPILTVDTPAILESINLDAYYESDSGSLFAVLYINGQEVQEDSYYDYGDDTYEMIFENSDNPILLSPGDTLELEITDNLEPSQLDVNINVLEILTQQ